MASACCGGSPMRYSAMYCGDDVPAQWTGAVTPPAMEEEASRRRRVRSVARRKRSPTVQPSLASTWVSSRWRATQVVMKVREAHRSVSKRKVRTED
nr:unnamed protein product [Digitaria exilis]